MLLHGLGTFAKSLLHVPDNTCTFISEAVYSSEKTTSLYKRTMFLGFRKVYVLIGHVKMVVEVHWPSIAKEQLVPANVQVSLSHQEHTHEGICALRHR